ncbi:hypothetical protein [Erwinia sorbitola]|uniref:DUF1161 domain-containing protein n=1 Tax=Erwinia sorbitola TaxID=2681984 RepID=A0A6I6EB08_9GAMM|nr:hypothetical protein [Erwinia sorbitola]MTD26510.1 hypothetical protein [Erwinia sorbitola]QGU86914.1 hypothetical protein GN242_06680 [Erwinia sorbitola]
MKKLIVAMVISALMSGPAFAISQSYRAKLERSGCTQVSELQGCDINKTKAQNQKAANATTPDAVKAKSAVIDGVKVRCDKPLPAHATPAGKEWLATHCD